MNALVDTHIFLWALSDPEKISPKYRTALESPSNTLWLSSVSIAEIMIKASLGKLEINFDPVAMAIESGFELIDFSANDALALKTLPFHHRDPFDRMLICQSIARAYPIMSDDRKLTLYDCKIL